MRAAVASAAYVAILALHCLPAGAQTAATLIVQAQPVTVTFRAYGQIQPIAITRVSAVESGVVTRLVLPGERISAGQELAVLAGPQAQSLLAERRSALRAAAVQLAVDRRKLTLRLVTRQTLAADEAAFELARGELQVALQTLTVRAPADGEVIGVEAANGSQVAAGQPILTLQTSQPWLQATYYGAQALAIHPGMTGRFQPASGDAVPVRVKTVSQALQADGGEQVGLFPVRPSGHGSAAAMVSWRSGQWGTVTLFGATRPMIAVPTRALILDRARWWVLVRTPGGDRQRRVVPGPASGWTTYISQGLRPGEQVVIENAYLEFHRGISQRYTPPD